MSVLVGRKAPEFVAPAVVNGGEFVTDFSLEQFKGKKEVVFFFYPLDFKTISTNYGVLAGDYDYDEDNDLETFSGAAVAYRGLFLIDKEGVVRHQVVNDLPLGRSIDEAIRMVDALQYFEKHGEVCPANWKPGEEAMEGSHEGVAEYLAKK
ncbi:MAG: alkyl hydroperoxide reductase [Bacteroidetes bacterium 4572_77]|nr:MAG: alkyl hydroperoxide reductase [Bacteroidetes bacterium 4572_77]